VVNGRRAEAGVARGSDSRTVTSLTADVVLLAPAPIRDHARTLHAHRPTTPMEHQSRTQVLVSFSEFFVF